jgi:hypothetical protein
MSLDDELYHELTGIFLINENYNKCSAWDNKLWHARRPLAVVVHV